MRPVETSKSDAGNAVSRALGIGACFFRLPIAGRLWTARLVVVGVLTALMAWGCSNSVEAPTPAPEPTSTATPAPTPTATPTPTPEPTPSPTAEVDVLFTYTYAKRLLQSSLYEEAIPQYDIVIRVMPNFALAYHGRGLALFHEEQPELALEDFDKAIVLKPEFADAYMSRGILYRDGGEPDKSESDFEKALTLYLADGNLRGVNSAQKALEGEEP